MHPKNLSITDFSYQLPEEKIAKYPLAKRDESRLLIYRQQQITEDRYYNLADHLTPGSLLVFNNTRVIEARLLFQKPTGGVVEIFCLEPHERYHTISTALQEKGQVYWLCLVGGASKWKPGQVLEKTFQVQGETVKLEARYVEKRPGSFVIHLSWTPAALTFAELLHLAGNLPLPPYMKRQAEVADNTRYQTVYSKEEGSVAAPTAGLHFTEEVFRKLQEKQIDKTFVTLHVGAGTFRPVKADKMEGHDMHAEFIDVSYDCIRLLIERLASPVIAVGTTSLRTLESLYWMGAKMIRNGEQQTIQDVTQWEAYDETENDVPVKDTLTALLIWMEKNKVNRIIARTSIIIAPGYRLRVAKGLITNFHQPQSTLLLLIAAIIGEKWKQLYDYALENNFRFLSYGDGCLLLP